MARLVIGIGDCRVSKDPSDVLVTHALGSCIAVLLYDPQAKVAGLLHYMLPESSLDPAGAAKRPCLFADTGISLLLRSACQLGAVQSRMVIVATGGAQMLDPTGTFNVGQRNHLAMLKIFETAGIHIYKEDIGGTWSRTVSIDVGGGRVQLRTPGRAKLDLFVAKGDQCRR